MSIDMYNEMYNDMYNSMSMNKPRQLCTAHTGHILALAASNLVLECLQ